MLIKKLWQTEENITMFGIAYKQEQRKWKGYYLFGFIPLWIDNYETIYKFF